MDRKKYGCEFTEFEILCTIQRRGVENDENEEKIRSIFSDVSVVSWHSGDSHDIGYGSLCLYISDHSQSGRGDEQNLLIMVKNELDYEIENLQKIASRLALDDRVQMAANVKKNFTSQDQMNLYYIYTECLSINMSEDFIEDVFLVFNNTKR